MRDDHRLRARPKLRDDDKLRDDHKLRVRSQISCVDPNRERFGIVVIFCHCDFRNKKSLQPRDSTNPLCSVLSDDLSRREVNFES
jgi:hypothetical protein